MFLKFQDGGQYDDNNNDEFHNDNAADLVLKLSSVNEQRPNVSLLAHQLATCTTQ